MIRVENFLTCMYIIREYLSHISLYYQTQTLHGMYYKIFKSPFKDFAICLDPAALTTWYHPTVTANF